MIFDGRKLDAAGCYVSFTDRIFGWWWNYENI